MEKVNWKSLKAEPYHKLAQISRCAAAEGCVLLKNDTNVLPINATSTVSLFGRSQIEYYKSGIGSGGQVNVPYVINILDGFCENNRINVNLELAEIYKEWIENNPPVTTTAWDAVPWSQREYVPDEETVKRARDVSDVAVIVIGRTAGENRDNAPEKGSWYLSESEEALLGIVSKHFERTVVLLNTGNIMDMSWVEKYGIKSVMYIWHGGQEGGRAVADVLCGDVSPCGKLPDTIAKSISDYPSIKNFGHSERNVYQEDIYVGYRYFETFEQERVVYPFGFGMSYSSFDTQVVNVCERDGEICIKVGVENTGNRAGKEVVSVYFAAPQGKLGKSARELVAFAKTGIIEPGKRQTLTLKFSITDMSAYDDSGITGNKNCYVMEAGEYEIFAGNDVRHAEKVYTYINSTCTVTERLSEALAPIEAFEVMHPVERGGKLVPEYREVATATVDYNEKLKRELPREIEHTGDRGIKLKHVKDGKNTMDEFVAQLSPSLLMLLVKGEGMRSPKVRPGSTGAFGGLSSGLSSFGIPAASMHDGPSGIRIDSGEKATGLPIGTALASTWDVELMRELGEQLSVELCTHQVDAVLSPGINIHRSPLNGRNFEYFSEDPYLTGKLAASFIKGIGEYGNSATVKHFAANSQEYGRLGGDSVVSQRALREIYLKAFKYAVKEGGATSLMTSYNKINGRLTVNDYMLNTTVLRDEWGYTGMVVSDWWPKVGYDSDGLIVLSEMVKAQNDVYMLAPDAVTYEDDLERAFKRGEITLGQLQRNAKNILKHLMNTHAFERFVENGGIMIKSLTEDMEALETVAEFKQVTSGEAIPVGKIATGRCLACIYYSSDEQHSAQIQVEIKIDGVSADGVCAKGTGGKEQVIFRDISIGCEEAELELVFPKDQMKIHRVLIKK